MPTDRLYYTNAYAREFEGAVVDLCDANGRPAVVLDRTAFYPTSGGQPHDTGTLGRARVVDVIDREDGSILHVLDGPMEAGVGALVHGAVDWDRRFDHMQQHTGQHVLSAAFERTLAARTVSFHLGAERSTIDLARDLAPGDLSRAEMAANAIVWDDRPVVVRFADEQEAAALPLRKEPRRTGRLRIVEVEGWDLSACGGTHVSRTGAIGTIAVTGAERYKGGTRVEFACGVRALRELGFLREAVTGSLRQLSVLPGELPDAIARLQADGKAQQRTIRRLQERLATLEAREMTARAVAYGDARVVVERSPMDAAGLKALAAAIAAQPNHAAVLFNPEGGLVVAARAAGLPIDAAEIVRSLTAEFGGRGGGRPELAQAGGLSAPGDAILDAARRLISGTAAS